MYIPTWLIVIVVVGVFLHFLNKKKKETFAPFRIQIFPKWYEILKEYEPDYFDSIPKEILDGIVAGVSSAPWETHVIGFTVLKWEENSHLFFNDVYPHFCSKANFNTPPSYYPYFWVKEGYEGYDLEITPRNSHLNLGDEPTKNNVKITTIPYDLFDELREIDDTHPLIVAEEIELTDGIERNFGAKAVDDLKLSVNKGKIAKRVRVYEEVTKKLERSGWKRKKLDHDSAFRGSSCIENKYFTVYYGNI